MSSGIPFVDAIICRRSHLKFSDYVDSVSSCSALFVQCA